MKLLYVSSPLVSSYAGGERYTEAMITGLDEHEHMFLGSSRALVDVFARHRCVARFSSAGREPVTPFGILCAPISLLRSVSQWLRHRQVFAQADWIISPTSFTESFFLFPLLILFTKKKLLVIIHNNRCAPSIYKNPLRFLLRYTLRHSTVVFVSDDQRREWEARGFLGAVVRVIGYGLAEVGAVTPVPADGVFHVGYLGRLHSEKNIDTLLSALALLPEVMSDRPAINVTIGGEGPDATRLYALQASLGMDQIWQKKHRIFIGWAGFVAATDDFYRAQHILVFPSSRESFGITLLEAWRLGRQVIVTDLPVFHPVLAAAPLSRRLLMPVGDPHALAALLATSWEQRDTFFSVATAESLRDIVQKKYGRSGMLRAYRALLT
jgi:glycosyltransferase involved in cell wall biosynthesis